MLNLPSKREWRHLNQEIDFVEHQRSEDELLIRKVGVHAVVFTEEARVTFVVNDSCAAQDQRDGTAKESISNLTLMFIVPSASCRLFKIWVFVLPI